MKPGSAARAVTGDAAAIGCLLAFTVTAFVLLELAKSGAADLIVQAVLLVFVATATLWVREQYVDGLDGKQWVIPGNIASISLVSGVIAVVLWFLFRWDGLGVSGLFAFWLGASALVTRMRDGSTRGNDGVFSRLFTATGKRRGRLGILFTVAGVLMILSGVLALGRVSGTLLSAALLVAVFGLLVVTPLGLELVSEAALTLIAAPNDPSATEPGRRIEMVWRWVNPMRLMLAGGIVFLVVVVTAVRLTSAGIIAIAFAVLLAIMISLASSTHAHVVILMAVVALLGVTPHQDHRFGVTNAHREPAQQALPTLVAIGDSYMSGEGASVYYEGTDDGGGNQCRRAPTAWAALAADSDYKAMAFLACSGARTGHVLYPLNEHPGPSDIPTDDASRRFAIALQKQGIIKSQDGGDGLSQLEKWRNDKASRNLTASMVVVSIGGNDAGFSTIGQMCLAPRSCADKSDLWFRALVQVGDQLRLAYDEIDETFPGVPVLTVGYPDPIHLSELCDQITLRFSERKFIQTLITGSGSQKGLNDIIAEVSAEFGFHYVDSMEGALKGQNLQLCDPGNDGRPGLNFIGLRSVRGAAEQRFNPTNWIHGSLHPNERGHAAMLRAFQTWMAKTTKEKPSQAPSLPPRTRVTNENAEALAKARARWATTAEATASQSISAAAPCDLTAQDDRGCRPQGADWALDQIRDVLLPRGLGLGLLAAFAAWCLSIGLLGWSRVRFDQKARRTASTGLLVRPRDHR